MSFIILGGLFLAFWRSDPPLRECVYPGRFRESSQMRTYGDEMKLSRVRAVVCDAASAR